MLELWLIRHGETDWNAQGRIQGSADQQLNARGLAQARRLGARLASVRFDAVYASDLQRAAQTARTALPDAEVQFDARLRELAYGVLEGRTWAELDAPTEAMAAHWREDPYGRRIPGGESYDDLLERFEAFRADLPAEGRVAAFTHGGLVRSALYATVGRPDGRAWGFAVENTGITRLRFRPERVTLVTVNDHAHLMNGVYDG